MVAHCGTTVSKHGSGQRVPATRRALACAQCLATGENYVLREDRVAPAGFEPAISALKGPRPGPLDDGAARSEPKTYQLIHVLRSSRALGAVASQGQRPNGAHNRLPGNPCVDAQ